MWLDRTQTYWTGEAQLYLCKNFVDNSVERQFLNCQKDNSGTVDKTLQELSKPQGNNTDIKDTEYSDTDPILSFDFSGRDVEKDEEFQNYYQYFYEELEMDYLSGNFPMIKKSWKAFWKYWLKPYVANES